MHDEEGFLSLIRQTPADDVARLVFADWLDEQDDPTCKLKAEFIRLELQMVESPEKCVNRFRDAIRLQQIAALLDPLWLIVVSHVKIEMCRGLLPLECPKQWDKLTPTDDAKLRKCEHKYCKRRVHYCETLSEAQTHVAHGDSVALTLALTRQMDDLFPPRFVSRFAMGRPTPRQRKIDRSQSHNIQRENWEEME
jgi:uncharacterized protein (TIGR02996 family)